VEAVAAKEVEVCEPDEDEQAKADGERIEAEKDVRSWSKVWGTAEETTMRVRANPKTMSEKLSMREVDRPRRRKP
jgi:hypothetical protein